MAISMIVQPTDQISARRPYLPALATVASVIVPGLAGTIATARATQRGHDVATATHPSSLSTSGAIQHGLPSTCGSTQSTPCEYPEYPM